ncbi:MAG TPA: hypothetical protein VII76_13525 [Acidimicrobiales bacterium]
MAGRRTASAFPRFAAAYGFDAAVYFTSPAPNKIKVPGVAAATRIIGLDTGQPTCSSCTPPINPTDFGIVYMPPAGRSVIKLVSGHLPDPSAPDQVLASSFTLAQDAEKPIPPERLLTSVAADLGRSRCERSFPLQ